MFEGLKYLIVGSGFFGATLAEHIANDLGEQVVVIDRRTHFGGNSYSEIDPETGIECHKYGSHIFHTQNAKIWEYVNRFTTFNQYRHRVWTTYQGRVFSMPINLSTINQYYGKAFSPAEAKTFLDQEVARDRVANPKNLEEQAINLIGRPLYEAFIRGYTAKQWETDPTKLPANIITRLPVRYHYDDRYFSDIYEGIPTDGYTKIFERMLKNPKITVKLGTDFFDIRDQIPAETLKTCQIIYTGPIDRYFDYKYGELSWRTIDLEKEIVKVNDFQGTSVMNYAEEKVPYTRIHEFKHFHPERKHENGKSVIFREFSRFAKKSDEPYYPINQDSDKSILTKYQEDAKAQTNVIFGGRLGSYKYYDMHQAIGAALLTYDRDIKPKATGVPYKSPMSGAVET
jgi:UDP-galactopyranose mutase